MMLLFHLLLAFLAGVLLGALFFGGLWWTVQRLMDSSRPHLFIAASFAVRTAAVMAGLYLMLVAGWPHLLAAVAGFVITRTVIAWKLRPAGRT